MNREKVIQSLMDENAALLTEKESLETVVYAQLAELQKKDEKIEELEATLKKEREYNREYC